MNGNIQKSIKIKHWYYSENGQHVQLIEHMQNKEYGSLNTTQIQKKVRLLVLKTAQVNVEKCEIYLYFSKDVGQFKQTYSHFLCSQYMKKLIHNYSN